MLLTIFDLFKENTGVIIAGNVLLGWLIYWWRLIWKPKNDNKKTGAELYPYFSVAEVGDARAYYIPTRYKETTDNQKELSLPLMPRIMNEFATDRERFFLILGESGMGKTDAMLNIYQKYARKRRKKYNIRLMAFNRNEKKNWAAMKADIEAIEDPRNTILLLDALDEEPNAIADYKAFIENLSQLTDGFHKVVVSVRTQFFESVKAIKYLNTGIKKGRGSFYHWIPLYIVPFNIGEAKLYINKRFGFLEGDKRVKARLLLEHSKQLMLRPMLLSNIEILILEPRTNYDYSYELYETLVNEWIKRDVNHFETKQEKRDQYIPESYEFNRYAAKRIYNVSGSGGKALTIDEAKIKQYKTPYSLKLKQTTEELHRYKTRSLLTRTEKISAFQFAHRSILEYFLAVFLLEGELLEEDFNLDAFSMAKDFYNEMCWHQIAGKPHQYVMISLAGVPIRMRDLTDKKDIQTFLYEAFQYQKEVVDLTSIQIKKYASYVTIFEGMNFRALILGQVGALILKNHGGYRYRLVESWLDLMRPELLDEETSCFMLQDLVADLYNNYQLTGRHKRLTPKEFNKIWEDYTPKEIELLLEFPIWLVADLDDKISLFPMLFDYFLALELTESERICTSFDFKSAGLITTFYSERLWDDEQSWQLEARLKLWLNSSFVPSPNAAIDLQKVLEIVLQIEGVKAEFKALDFLDLHSNQIREISAVSGLSQLTKLGLHSNQIREISAVSGLSQLTELYLSTNQIREISAVSGLSQLTKLYLSTNQIREISAVSGLSQLTKLGLHSNQIREISAVSGLSQLTELGLHINQIREISAVSGLSQLTKLDLSANQIREISAVSGLSQLTKLGLETNQIREISAVSGLSQLTELYLSTNQIREISAVSGLSQLTELDLSTNQIREISAVSGLSQLTELYLSTNQITEISAVSGLSQLTILDLSANQITEISAVSGLSQLTELSLHSNQIREISAVSGLSQLTELYLSTNQIREISAVSGLSQLTELYLSTNQITEISAVSGLSQLTELSLSTNQITEISAVSGLSQLTELSLHSNQIREISAVSGLSQLTELYLHTNQITEISAVSGLSQLTKLGLETNQIREISAVSGLSQLTELYLSTNQITEISAVSGLSQLTILGLHTNQITDITPIQNLKNLKELYLSGNLLTDINFLSNHPHLEVFTMSKMPIHDFSPLLTLKKLNHLKVRESPYLDLTIIQQLTTLKELYLGGNPLTDHQKTALQAALPNCTIDFDSLK